MILSFSPMIGRRRIKTENRNDHKFSNRWAWRNSLDPDQGQGLHRLQFRRHVLVSLLYGNGGNGNLLKV